MENRDFLGEFSGAEKNIKSDKASAYGNMN
jgi:hypothetical protein